MSCRNLLYIVLLVHSISCAKVSENDFLSPSVAWPEFPLVYKGDTLNAPYDENEITIVGIVTGSCWTCLTKVNDIFEMQNYLSRKEIITTRICFADIFDYEQVDAILTLFQIDDPVYLDKGMRIHTLLGDPANNFCLLMDSNHRIVWYGEIPLDNKGRKAMLKRVRLLKQTTQQPFAPENAR